MKWVYSIVLLVVGFVSSQSLWAASQTSDSTRRGKYIVEHVAMCVECHTPRNEQGELLTSQYLEGAPIPVNPPPYPNMKWAVEAPGIAGLVGYTKQQGIKLLTEGITSDGRIPNPPMPPFRLTRADAEAVVDYLKSLK
jgi:mono/diheme cytochrome c family protein